MPSEYPTINRQLRFSLAGSPLEVLEKTLPPLSANEILVKVHKASINPCDLQLWKAAVVGIVAGDKGIGRDYAGEIVAVGTHVKGWATGDKVFGLLFEAFGQGTFSQYVRINPSKNAIAKNPGCFTHEQAAALPLVALTAFACLEWLPPATGSPLKVIIVGASGGTGSMIIQLAKLVYNCHVTAICSSKNADYVRGLGADEVIDYTSQDVSQTLLEQYKANGQSDLLIDCVGGTKLLDIYQVIIQPKGAYVTIVGDKTNVRYMGGPVTYFTNPVQFVRYLRTYLFGGPRYACIALAEKSSYLEKLVSLGERGELNIEIQEVVEGAFDGEVQGWKKAFEAMQSMRVRGKVVVSIE